VRELNRQAGRVGSAVMFWSFPSPGPDDKP